MSDTQMRRGGHRPVERKAYFQGVPWEVDVMLPAQFVAAPAQQPEKRLMLAVLEDALLAACSRKPHERLARREARDWLASDSRSWPFSAANICDQLGIDIEWIRRRLDRSGDGVADQEPAVELSRRAVTFARISREVRAAFGLTQKDLAMILKKSVQAVQSWEQEMCEPEGDAGQQLLRLHDRRPVACDGRATESGVVLPAGA